MNTVVILPWEPNLGTATGVVFQSDTQPLCVIFDAVADRKGEGNDVSRAPLTGPRVRLLLDSHFSPIDCAIVDGGLVLVE